MISFVSANMWCLSISYGIAVFYILSLTSFPILQFPLTLTETRMPAFATRFVFE